MVSSTPRPHFTSGKDPVSTVQKAGWAPGPVWTGGISRPHRDSVSELPARSQSLYRLSYRAPIYIILHKLLLAYIFISIEERVELYLYSTYGHSWTVLG